MNDNSTIMANQPASEWTHGRIRGRRTQKNRRHEQIEIKTQQLWQNANTTAETKRVEESTDTDKVLDSNHQNED